MPQALRRAQRAVRDADRRQAAAWGRQIAEHLPPERRESFREDWGLAVAELAAGSGHPFDAPAIWAPYLAIGWPGALRWPAPDPSAARDVGAGK